MGPKGDNTTPSVTNPNTSQPASGPDVTNVTEPVIANVDLYATPFGATILPSSKTTSRAEATNFVAEVPTHAHTRAAHNTWLSSADVGGDDRWNIPTCGDIPSDTLVDLTSDNTQVYTTESSFGKSYQRPSNDLVNVKNIPSTAAANIPMHGDISSGFPRDRSDNVMTNLTAHCSMGVSHENAFTLPPVPGNVMIATAT
jgi:hypothetical protein